MSRPRAALPASPARLAAPALLAAAFLLAACAGGGAGARTGASDGDARPGAAPPPAPAPRVADDREVRASDISPADRRRFAESWRLFVTHDPAWPMARDAWLAEGGAAPYVLAENLFRYFWSASAVNRRDEIMRVGVEAREVGEPAVAYFAKALVTDRWPLAQPVRQEVFNPDDISKPIVKTFHHFDIDDLTRQHAAHVLAYIGVPAVPTLTSRAVMASPIAGARRYGAYALAAIATDEAVEALARMQRRATDWQERAAATKALGFALHRNEAARPHLEAALEDPDPFVREKAEEGLAGQTRMDF